MSTAPIPHDPTLPPNTLAAAAALTDADLVFPFAMAPYCEAKPWGGRRLEALYRKALPPDVPIGECWEVSAIPGKNSRVAGGILDGMSLGELIARWPLGTLGRRTGGEFPLLIKFIDAREHLSVQVHPDDATAQRLEGYPRGKTEAWVILETGDGAPGPGHQHPVGAPAEVIHGIVPGTDLAALERDANSPAIERHLLRKAIRPGTVVPVTAGTVHAILGGTVLCEVQQTCDITYRLYDWDRKPARPLHLRQSIECIKDGTTPDLFDLPAGDEVFRRPAPCYQNEYFSFAAVDIPANNRDFRLDLADGDFAIAICLEDGGAPIDLYGMTYDDHAIAPVQLAAGHSAFLPAAMRGTLIRASKPARILWVRPGL